MTNETADPSKEGGVPFSTHPGFLVDVPFGGVMRQEAPEDEEDGLDLGATRERGRVMRVGDCVVDAVFAFMIYERESSGDYEDRGLVRWQRLQPEVGMPWNARLGARIKVQAAAPMPGTATVTITRDGPGPPIANPTRTARGANVAELRAAFAGLPEVTIDPPAIPANGTPVRETITAIIVWDPDDGDPCRRMVEPITVRWYRGRRFKVIAPTKVGRRDGTHVRVGTGTVPRPPGGPDAKHVVPTEAFWEVDDPQGCCNGGSGYAVIQFVRHRWNLGEHPRIRGQDDYSLDVLDSEIDHAEAEPPEDYDPTFTHNPQGSAPNADPVVYPGPDGSGGTAIVQIDEPGLPKALYDRFLEHGGEFTWRFVSLLVCVVEGGTAAGYLDSGLVEQEMHWTLQLVFPGGGDAPTVVSGKRSGFPKKHVPCRPLQRVLRAGDLMDAYANPSDHTIAIPG